MKHARNDGGTAVLPLPTERRTNDRPHRVTERPARFELLRKELAAAPVSRPRCRELGRRWGYRAASGKHGGRRIGRALRW